MVLVRTEKPMDLDLGVASVQAVNLEEAALDLGGNQVVAAGLVQAGNQEEVVALDPAENQEVAAAALVPTEMVGYIYIYIFIRQETKV